MNGEGETLPTDGAAGAMDPSPDAGEGNPATPEAPTVSGQQHKTNHNRVKLADILTRLELLESRNNSGPSDAKVPDAKSESKVEVLSDAKDSEQTPVASGISGTGAAGQAEDAGSGAVSGPLDDISDALTEIVKPFKGLRLGSWNYGRKPK